MSSIVGRALALFVSPAPPVAEPSAWQPPMAARSASDDASTRFESDAAEAAPSAALTVVLGASDGAAPVGAASANELRCRARARTALLIVWAPSEVPAAAGPAWPAARRLAERLGAGESSAVARGRLVRVDLPSDPGVAAVRVTELLTGDAPAVLVLAGPRPVAFDPVLAAARLVVLVADAARPSALTGLAAEELAHLGPGVSVMPPMGSAVARVLAGAGLGRLRRLSSAERMEGE